MRTMKTILRKMVGPLSLSFEEFTTILSEAETTLNSRPIIPLTSNKPGEDLALTPGHFFDWEATNRLPTYRS